MRQIFKAIIFAIVLLSSGASYAETKIVVSVAAQDNSVDDAFAKLEKDKGGKPSKSGGDDPFAGLEKGKGSKAGQGMDAAFNALNNSVSNGSVEFGHGIEAGFQGVAAQRAQQAALAAEAERVRMEQEAKKQDEEMKSDCYCIYNNCVFLTLTPQPCSGTWEKKQACEKSREWNEDKEAEFQEEKRIKQAKKAICDDWKAAGPKANSESFKAQLRQKDDAIATAQRKAAEAGRQRDALIAADVKRVAAQEENIRLKAEADAANNERAAIAAAKAKADAANAEREDKLHKWCMTGKNISYCDCWRWAPKGGTACLK